MTLNFLFPRSLQSGFPSKIRPFWRLLLDYVRVSVIAELLMESFSSERVLQGVSEFLNNHRQLFRLHLMNTTNYQFQSNLISV